MAHINLTREADAILVAPASADFIAKLAQGRADELLSLLCLARPIERCPLLVAPAMNREMWAHPATQRNLAQLARRRRDACSGPGSGDQACGEIGDGRMLEAAELLRRHWSPSSSPSCCAGKRVLITAGPTFEADRPGARHHQPVERQDGLRDRARRAPRPAPTSRWSPGRCTCRRRAACAHRRARARGRCTTRCCRGAARTTCSSPPPRWPTGGRPTLPTQKIKKDGRQGARRRFELTENPDILAAVARAAEARRTASASPPRATTCAQHAREKRERKGVPLIVGNLGPGHLRPATTTRCCWSTRTASASCRAPTS